MFARLQEVRKLFSGDPQPQIRPREKVGCPACRFTGYSGRTTIWELLVMSDAVRDRLLSKRSEMALESIAKEAGMISMFQDGVDKVLGGETTLDEVLRATRTI